MSAAVGHMLANAGPAIGAENMAAVVVIKWRLVNMRKCPG